MPSEETKVRPQHSFWLWLWYKCPEKYLRNVLFALLTLAAYVHRIITLQLNPGPLTTHRPRSITAGFHSSFMSATREAILSRH